VTTLLLVRHAEHARLGAVLCGQMACAPLNARGRRQVRVMGEHLMRENLAALLCSPRERTHRNALTIGTHCCLMPETDAAFDEIDDGMWTGSPFESVGVDPASWACRSARMHDLESEPPRSARWFSGAMARRCSG